MKDYITIIGGGLAGCEAAYQIAKKGIKVKLYEMKPDKFSPAHSNKDLAEIVCSNSFKSNLMTNACGLLKEELRTLDSLLIKIADETNVPAGQALAVDREEFSKKVTKEIENNPLIEVIRKEIRSKFDDCNYQNSNNSEGYNNNKSNNEKTDIDLKENQDVIFFEDLLEDGIVIIATGPLTSDSLSKGIQNLTGTDGLHFYDAEAPIIEKDSIDFSIAFYGNRYDQEKGKDETLEEWHKRIDQYNNNELDRLKQKNICSSANEENTENIKNNSYINLPMNKEEYEKFYNELVNADVVVLHDFEKREIFEGCMPVEVMAKRGIDTLRFGPLKPVGFDDPRTGKRPYAIIQLRQDNAEASLYNIVGFQTNLKFGEQKRVFSMIPGLENAEFVKYGVMHRNTFINSSKLLDNTYNLKMHNLKAKKGQNDFENCNDINRDIKSENQSSNIYFAGQITGVEGYVESISSGMIAGLNAANKYLSKIVNEKIYGGDNVEEEKIIFSDETMIGALAKYISTPNKNFEPMNANYGILPPLKENIKDKKLKYQKLSSRAIELIKNHN